MGLRQVIQQMTPVHLVLGPSCVWHTSVLSQHVWYNLFSDMPLFRYIPVPVACCLFVRLAGSGMWFRTSALGAVSKPPAREEVANMFARYISGLGCVWANVYMHSELFYGCSVRR